MIALLPTELLVEQNIHLQGYGVVLNLSLEVMSEMLSMSFVRNLRFLIV